MGMLDGKVAIVTGAGKGLGRAVAEEYAAEGATVVVSDIDAGAAEQVADGIDRAVAIACDVTDEGQVKLLVDRAVEAHGGLHVMVANAGIGITPQPVARMSLEDWRAVTSVNLDGIFLCLRHSAPAIIAAGGGSIVNVASVSGFRGLALAAPYAAAKAGVLSLTKSAAVELRDQGLQVHAICPGFIETDLAGDRKAAFEEGLGLEAGPFDEVIANSQGRYATPDEVARMAVWLASGRASFSTGTAFVVDGGLHSALL